MQNRFGDYAQIDSPAHRMDPRWKLAALVVSGTVVVCLQSVPAAGVALLAALALVPLSRLPWRWLLVRLAGVTAFLSVCLILLPLTMPGPDIGLGPIQLSERGLEVAVLVCLKALAFVVLVLVVVATSPLDVTLQAARALHVPSLVVQLLMLTHRYISLLGDELAKLRVALRVRCYRNRPRAHSYRTIGNVTGTLLVRSYERAERVSQAMSCRAFDGRFRTLRTFQTRPSDVLKFCLVLLGLAVLPLAIELGHWLLSQSGGA